MHSIQSFSDAHKMVTALLQSVECNYHAML